MAIFSRCTPLAALLILAACGQTQSVSTAKQSEGTPLLPPLLGQWELCEGFAESEGDTLFGVKTPYAASLSELSFRDQNQAQLKARFTKDKDCKEVLTEEDLVAYAVAVERACREQYPEASCTDLIDVQAMPLQVEFAMTYEASPADANGIGTIDVTSPGDADRPDASVTTYQTYKVSEAGLQFSGACLAEDIADQICDALTGDRPDNRSTTLEPELYLRK